MHEGTTREEGGRKCSPILVKMSWKEGEDSKLTLLGNPCLHELGKVRIVMTKSPLLKEGPRTISYPTNTHNP